MDVRVTVYKWDRKGTVAVHATDGVVTRSSAFPDPGLKSPDRETLVRIAEKEAGRIGLARGGDPMVTSTPDFWQVTLPAARTV